MLSSTKLESPDPTGSNRANHERSQMFDLVVGRRHLVVQWCLCTTKHSVDGSLVFSAQRVYKNRRRGLFTDQLIYDRLLGIDARWVTFAYCQCFKTRHNLNRGDVMVYAFRRGKTEAAALQIGRTIVISDAAESVRPSLLECHLWEGRHLYL